MGEMNANEMASLSNSFPAATRWYFNQYREPQRGHGLGKIAVFHKSGLVKFPSSTPRVGGRMTAQRTTPWKRSGPATKARVKLTAASVAWAKTRARKAGRRYPNLVDNMAAARRQKEKTQPRAAKHP